MTVFLKTLDFHKDEKQSFLKKRMANKSEFYDS